MMNWVVPRLAVMCIALSSGEAECPPAWWVVDARWWVDVPAAHEPDRVTVHTGNRERVRHKYRPKKIRYFVKMRTCFTFCSYGTWETDEEGYKMAKEGQQWP